MFPYEDLNYYPNYSTHRLYFGEVVTPYRLGKICILGRPRIAVVRNVHCISSKLSLLWYLDRG